VTRSPLIHPLLFASYPIVFLVAENLDDQIDAGSVLATLGATLAATLLLFGFTRLVFRGPHAAAFVTSGLVLLFFSFGHVEDVVDPFGFGTEEKVLLLEWALIALSALLIAVRFRERLRAITGGLNLLAAVLVALNLIPIVTFAVGGSRASRASDDPPQGLHAEDPKRDIYYIIFDRYANARTLEDLYGFDNGPMLGWLERQGIYVAHDSVANYPKTAHSLASSLNMTLLGDLAERMGEDSGDWRPVVGLLRGFRVARYLQSLGYRYYHIGSWWTPTREDPSADVEYRFGAASEFASTLLSTTLWDPISRRLDLSWSPGFEREEYERVLYQFDRLEQIPDDPAPTFALVHFTLPHPPFVFDRNGDYVSDVGRQWVNDEGYVEQLIYTNRRIRELVTKLLAGPASEDPILILQSDEGPHPRALEIDEMAYEWTEATDEDLMRKLAIFNAYYFPGVGHDALKPSITPVNTFRLVFDLYFGADLPLLPDRTWVFEDQGHPYRLSEVTSRLRRILADAS